MAMVVEQCVVPRACMCVCDKEGSTDKYTSRVCMCTSYVYACLYAYVYVCVCVCMSMWYVCECVHVHMVCVTEPGGVGAVSSSTGNPLRSVREEFMSTPQRLPVALPTPSVQVCVCLCAPGSVNV